MNDDGRQADERVQLVPWDDTWPARFEAERGLLEEVLAPWLAGPIEHVGSTAVPGMIAKPVIDIMAGIASLEGARAALPPLAGAGYRHAPYRIDVMHWFCKPSPAHRTHHLHLVPWRSRLWRERLAFRDRLRSDAATAAAYAALKRRLAREHAGDREAYTRAKTAFIEEVLRECLEAGLLK